MAAEDWLGNAFGRCITLSGDLRAVCSTALRLGESFLYANVLAARKPDVATADRLQQALIEGILP